MREHLVEAGFQPARGNLRAGSPPARPPGAVETPAVRHASGRRRRGLGFILVLLTLGLLAMLIAPATYAQDIESEVRAVAKRLQCPVCESVSVADSPSELAVQMRGVIREQLQRGDSSDQVVRYFVERYGESVLVEPPRHGVALLVWLGPVIGLVVGGALLMFWWRSRGEVSARPAPTSAKPEDDWRLSAAERELRELGGQRP